MDKVSQRVLIVVTAASLVGLSAPAGQRFYADDPLWKMPPPVPVHNPLKRKINYLYDFFVNSLDPPRVEPQPAVDVNTLGEVPDGLWYTNRHYWHPMTLDQLRQGPAHGNAPVPPFRVVGAKTEGVTPGFQIRDAMNRHYFCKPDPQSNPEMATAADVIGSKFFYAFGYQTPENYIAYFANNEISIDPSATVAPEGEKPRQMRRNDLAKILRLMPRDREGRYRVIASLEVEGKGMGPFRWTGTREDDPNDIFPHEHRRSLRGLYVFCAWLNHTDIKAGNTYDSLVEWDGVPAIRHYLIDFGSSLGSDSDEPKNARFGHEFMIERDKKVLVKMFSLGLYSPDWERARYPGIPAVGRFEAATFEPDAWTSNYPVPAFFYRLPNDEFWAAKQVMSFTNEQILAVVETGEFTNPKAVEYITKTLIERRDKIGRAFFAKLLPFDRFEVRGGQLAFEDLGLKYGFNVRNEYDVQWYRFDNTTGQRTLLPGATGPQVPRPGEFAVAEIRSRSDAAKSISVYLRGMGVVGIDRKW